MLCIQRARLELKECFDAAVSELTSVFLVLSVYYLHRLDNAKLVRYASFARQSLRELPFVPPDLAASVRMLQVSGVSLLYRAIHTCICLETVTCTRSAHSGCSDC
jgi:hypothetical protein